MNKKGFTLTELLVVLSILLIVVSSSLVGMKKISDNSKLLAYNELINQVESATDIYYANHDEYRIPLLNNLLSSNCTIDGNTINNCKCTYVYILQNEGLINIDYVNPIDNKRFPANLCVYSYVENSVIIHKFAIDKGELDN